MAIEITPEMVQEIYSRIDFVNHGDDGIREGLAAVLSVVERDYDVIPIPVEATAPEPEELCGAVYERQDGKPNPPPCGKPRGHENGPATDWKRGYHSNGMFKWPVAS